MILVVFSNRFKSALMLYFNYIFITLYVKGVALFDKPHRYIIKFFSFSSFCVFQFIVLVAVSGHTHCYHQYYFQHQTDGQSSFLV